MAIGYIVTKNKVNGVLPDIEVVKDLQDVPEGEPYILVGYKESKIKFPDMSILDKTLPNNGMWTFSKTEKRDEHERDLQGFQNKCYNHIVDGTEYIYVNVFAFRKDDMRRFISFLGGKDRKYYFCKGNMLYMCQGDERKVYGVSLNMTRYAGINNSNLIKRIVRNRNNTVRFDKLDEFDDMKSISMETWMMPIMMRFFGRGGQNVSSDAIYSKSVV